MGQNDGAEKKTDDERRRIVNKSIIELAIFECCSACDVHGNFNKVNIGISKAADEILREVEKIEDQLAEAIKERDELAEKLSVFEEMYKVKQQYARSLSVNQLRRLMINFSEEFWCQGWRPDLEFLLWDTIFNKNVGKLGKLWKNLEPFIELSNEIEGWVTYEGYVTMDVWLEMYGKWKDKN